MLWIQRRVGELYGQLYARFGRGSFTFAEASALVAVKAESLAVAFSKLHAAGALIVFRRSRPRVYRLLDPRSFVLLAAGAVGLVRWKREEYVQLVYDVLRAVRERLRLASFAVYGSVARGDARASSDLDVLLVADSFQGSLASRMDSLAWVEAEVAAERQFLRSHGYRPGISFYPLRREEAQRLPLLFLDLTEDAVILIDERGFLANELARLRARLLLMGARRIPRGDRWYWDLKPGARLGELIEV